MVQKIKNKYSKTKKFLQTDIWRIQTDEVSRRRAFYIRFLRILLITYRGYEKDKITLRASALTFYMLLSIVPIAAMAFGVAKGFGLEKILERQLRRAIPGQEEVIDYILNFAYSMLESTQGGIIAGIGLGFLFYIILRLLNNIETSFNAIWQTKEQRSYSRKFSDYISIMLFAPILFVLSSSMTVFVTTKIKDITQQIELLEYFTPFILFLLRLLPYTLIWIGMILLYIIMPNAKVNFKPALISGILAGTAYQVTQWAYITFQVGVSRYNAIYGSFAALPLLLIWVQLSWLIVLIGSKLGYAIQECEKYEFKSDVGKISTNYHRLISLAVTHFIVKTFINSDNPMGSRAISDKLKIPQRFVHVIINDLVEARIISPVMIGEDIVYQPGQDTQRLTTWFVISKLDECGFNDLHIPENEDMKKIEQHLQQLKKSIASSDGNILLRDI